MILEFYSNLRWLGTVPGETTLSFSVLLPCWMRGTSSKAKGKNCFSKSKFGRVLSFSDANRKSWQLFPFVKMVKKPGGVSIHLKTCNKITLNIQTLKIFLLWTLPRIWTGPCAELGDVLCKCWEIVKILIELIHFQEKQLCHFHFPPFPSWGSSLKIKNLLL